MYVTYLPSKWNSWKPLSKLTLAMQRSPRNPKHKTSPNSEAVFSRQTQDRSSFYMHSLEVITRCLPTPSAHSLSETPRSL